MLTYWHIEAREDHLLCRWLREALERRHRGWRCANEDLVSWDLDAPGEAGVGWRRFPDRREGESDSPCALRAAAEPDRAVTLRPHGVTGGSLETDFASCPWRWVGVEAHPDPAAIPLAPEDRSWPPIAPGRIAFLGGESLACGWTSGRALGEAVQTGCPGWTPELVVDAPALSRVWAGGEGAQYPCPVDITPPAAEAVVVLEAGFEWAPVVLEAARAGRSVIVRADAEYGGLIDPAGALWWDGTACGLLDLLHERQTDPAAAELRSRRGQAWSRRWSPGRSLEKLENLAFSHSSVQGAADAPVRARARRWTLRREVGIGDVVFTLVVGAELKRRDPTCRLTVHTAPGHAEWVSWFPFVDRVTSGPFAADPSETVGDFETHFPMGSRKDRSLALGEQIGAPPREWLPPPQVPHQLRERAEELLAGVARPRIAFAPVARDRSPARSLPAAAARELARGLAEQGGVVWLEERAADDVPEEVLDLSGRCALAVSFAVLEACDLCVSVDSGLLYAAAALGKPVVGIFSHIGALQRLWLAPRFIALEPALPCAPCGETEGSLHCRSTAAPGAPFRLACVEIAPMGTAMAAARRLLDDSEGVREVWRAGSGDERIKLRVAGIPTPWPGC